MVRKEIACGARQNQVTGCLRDPKKSVPVAGAENENGKTCDDRKNNDHPVLALEAKKGKVLDQKVQRPRAPIFRARRKIKRSGFKNILFLYFHSAVEQSVAGTCPAQHSPRAELASGFKGFGGAAQPAAMSSKRA
jgi:hypothetical protein